MEQRLSATGSVSEVAQTNLRRFAERYGPVVSETDCTPLSRLGREAHSAPKTFLSRAGKPCERVHLVLSGVVRHRYAYGGYYHTVGLSLPQELLADAADF